MSFNIFDKVNWSVKPGVWTIVGVKQEDPPQYWIELAGDYATQQWAREEELTVVQAHNS